MGDGAFQGCEGLQAVTLSGNITYGKDVFADCVVLEEAALRSDTGDSFFGVLGSIPCLTRVSLAEGVTHIGDGAFFGCGQLTEITLPATVTVIDGRAFMRCESLESITLPPAEEEG